MVNSFTVGVTHEDSSKKFTCTTRREFLTQVTKFFGLDSQSILFIDKKTSKEIGINDIVDEMFIEIKKKRVNGERSEESAVEAVKVPNLENLRAKLTNNYVLTGLERKYILSKLSCTNSENRKRKAEDESVQKVNKKVQVCSEQLIHTRAIHTQTDLLKPSTSRSARSVEQPSTSKDLTSEVRRLCKSEKKDNKKISDIMAATFDERRDFILRQKPVISHIKEKYPLLFDVTQVRLELNRIFYDGKDLEFLLNLEKSADAILSLVADDNNLLQLLKKKADSVTTEKKKTYAKEVGALLMLSNVVFEKRLFLHTLDEECPVNDFPYIEASCNVSDLFIDLQTFKIIVEGQVFCEPNDFKEAVLCLISSFFIFNISYPDYAFNTLVIMEKLFLEADDTDGNTLDDSTQQIIKLIQLKTSAKP